MTKDIFWSAVLVSFLSIALFVLTISWLDVSELQAIGIALLFAALIGTAVSLRIRRSLQEAGSAWQEQHAKLAYQVRQLTSQHDQAQTILDSMMEGVCALDREGRVLWVNRSAERLFGLQSQEAVGKRLADLVRQPQVEALVQEVLTKRQPEAREVQVFGPMEQTIRFQATPCEGGEEAAALVVVAQDVTEVRRLERMRREFVANVSHELKTPVTSIKGLTETLLNGALEDAANNRRFVTLIDEDATRLTRLIDDLLELSHIESKATPLQLQPVRLQELFEGLVARFRNQAEVGQVTLDARVPENVPPVRGDPDRLRQIFVNLLDNSIKFNKPAGRVSISTVADGAEVRITVADTGCGIPEADLPRIFERFYRVDKARSRELGGTGLGLSIIKHLVDLHQGRVSVASRLGEGSAFPVVLPRSSAS